LLLIAAAAYAGYERGPWLWRRARFLAVQRQCMEYTAPPDVVALETDPVEGQKLLDAGAGYRRHPRTGHVSRDVRCWNSYPYLSEGLWQPGLLFLHRRTDSDGVERLVSVELEYDESGNFSFLPSAFTPGTLTWGPGVTHSGKSEDELFRFRFCDRLESHGGTDLGHLEACDRLRVFAGQPDPHDPSRFTVGYELNGVRGTLDGRLHPGSRIEIRPRTGHYVDTPFRMRWYSEGTRCPPGAAARPVQPME
jgi:hypothetical protein